MQTRREVRHLPRALLFLCASCSNPARVATECIDPPGAAATSADTRAAFSKLGTHGIDVSHHNGPIAWRSLTDAGLTYSFMKATEGTRYVDPGFREHWSAAKKCGVLRGAYHFFDPASDAREQARHFSRVLLEDPGELPPTIDVERGFGDSRRACEELEADLQLILDEADRALGTRAMIYSGHAFWLSSMCNSQHFNDRPLWIAHYGTAEPQLFGGWKNWHFWQYTDHFHTRKTAIDLDRAANHSAQMLSRKALQQ